MNKIKSIKYFVAATAVLALAGCGAQPVKPLYNYENYSDSYYAYKKNATPETTGELQKSIEKAIENTQASRSGRVAPGLYANLGYMYLKAGKPNEAVVNFNKEKATYPESTLFMDRIINKIQAAEGNKK